MKHFVQTIGYARIRYINGIIFMLLGAFVVVQSVMSVGFKVQAISAYVLGLAFIALGVFRMKLGWPKK